jgi:hypothetical protein
VSDFGFEEWFIVYSFPSDSKHRAIEALASPCWEEEEGLEQRK